MSDSAQIIPKPTSQFLSVLRIRKFMIFAISQAVSLFGDKLDYMALLAMIAYFAKLYHWEQARAISFLSVIITLPTIVFGPLAGVLVDRWNRVKMMIICDSARALLVALIPLLILQTGNLFLVYAIAFFVFLFGLFFNTGRLSVIPNLVSPRRLLAANSFINLIGRVSTFLGMLIGGILVDWQIWRKIGIRHSWSAGFYLDSLTYWVSVIALITIARELTHKRTPNSAPSPSGLAFEKKDSEFKIQNTATSQPADSELIKAVKSTVSDIKQAYYVIRQLPPVLFVYASIFLLVILGAAVFVLFVPIIQEARTELGLGLGTKGVGFIGAIGSIGLMLSSMIYGITGHRLKKWQVILVSFFILGIIACLLALLKTFIFVVPLALIAGLLLSPILIASDTLLHENVPEAARGRIFSTREWILHLSFAFAAFLIGQLTIFIPKRSLLFGIGAFVIILSIIGFWIIKDKKIG
ncbi:MAG: MFS transporter [candidate division WOR-3 bacterium]